VQADVEVPGTPEEVWQAIATGPGISSWFVPSEVEEREGGAAVSHFGSDSSMDSVGAITAWDPPRRYVVETPELGAEASPVATEWTVEARDGGTCVVRVVHRWFASTDDWDEQFEGHTYGWHGFFRILRLYLTHFRGQPCSALQLAGVAPEPKAEAWAALAGPLGLAGAAVGQRVSAPAGAPPLAGQVEHVGEDAYPEELLIRLDEPAPGLAHLFAMPMGGQVYLSIRFFLYGDRAPAAAERAEPTWQAWLNAHFPTVEESAAS
jgi:uncharacterized protein YndB with AHSA1/START domain